MAYGGGAGTLAGQGGTGGGLAVGGRRGMSAIAWHPDNASFALLSVHCILMLSRLRDLSRPPRMILPPSLWCGTFETHERPKKYDI